jgi:hypothetical protein
MFRARALDVRGGDLVAVGCWLNASLIAGSLFALYVGRRAWNGDDALRAVAG